MTELAEKRCRACDGETPRLSGVALNELARQVHGWTVVGEHHILKEYKFSNFVKALAFVNRVGAIAEEQGHHPEICFTWGKAEVKIWTHKIDGLTESDFILAAKIDQTPQE